MQPRDATCTLHCIATLPSECRTLFPIFSKQRWSEAIDRLFGVPSGCNRSCCNSARSLEWVGQYRCQHCQHGKRPEAICGELVAAWAHFSRIPDRSVWEAKPLPPRRFFPSNYRWHILFSDSLPCFLQRMFHCAFLRLASTCSLPATSAEVRQSWRDANTDDVFGVWGKLLRIT